MERPVDDKPSHKYPQRRGDEGETDEMKGSKGEKKSGAADLCAGHVVVRRSQPHCGDAPSSRLVADPNLWPRHLRLFMR